MGKASGFARTTVMGVRTPRTTAAAMQSDIFRSINASSKRTRRKTFPTCLRRAGSLKDSRSVAVVCASRKFPWCQALGRGIVVAALHPVVHVLITYRAEGLVVEGGLADHFAEFLGEVMLGFEAVGGCGDFDLAGFKELLKAAVEEMGDLSAEKHARLGHHHDPLAVSGGSDDGGCPVFRDHEALCDAWGLSNIKLEVAKFADSFIEGKRFCLLWHGGLVSSSILGLRL